jgi:hypothetical protein
MTSATKFAVVLICAATCALSLLPRGGKAEREPARDSVTPAQLRQTQVARWLLV